MDPSVLEHEHVLANREGFEEGVTYDYAESLETTLEVVAGCLSEFG
jgi:hypothetical protein